MNTWRREWLEEKVCSQAFGLQLETGRDKIRKESICLPLYFALRRQGRPVAMESLERHVRSACANGKIVRVGKGLYCHPFFCGNRVKKLVTKKPKKPVWRCEKMVSLKDYVQKTEFGGEAEAFPEGETVLPVDVEVEEIEIEFEGVKKRRWILTHGSKKFYAGVKVMRGLKKAIASGAEKVKVIRDGSGRDTTYVVVAVK